MKFTTGRIALDAIGIALFVALSMCLQVPVFQNYYLCLGYAVMAVYLYTVGIPDGTIIGVIGVIAYCLVINGLRGMPGWAIGNIAVAIIFGFAMMVAKDRAATKAVGVGVMVIGAIVGNLVGILLVKSMVEVIVYAQPMVVRMGRNFFGFVSDMVMCIVSIPLCTFLHPRLKDMVNG